MAELAPLPRRIAWVRPRLGIGGSERLVVDAAVELARRSHEVRVFAPGVPGAPQFEDVASGRVSVQDSGAFLPAALAGRLRVPCALLRARWAIREAARWRPDVLLCDVVAHVVPLARRLTGVPVLFYCHYPDALLVPPGHRPGPGYASYRRVLDRWEAAGFRGADRVLVNSRFTAEALGRTFPGLPASPAVLPPGVRLPDGTTAPRRDRAGAIELLSVARFDPRKGLPLAVSALGRLAGLLPRDVFARVRLTLAGHLEPAWPESRATLAALRAQAREAGLQDKVAFRVSPGDAELRALFEACHAVVYTPAAEHFGYVPLEAMAAGRPVVAVAAGGPAETIRDGETGRLCEPTPDAFAAALAELVRDEQQARRMGEAARRHVERHFTVERFGDALEAALEGVLPAR